MDIFSIFNLLYIGYVFRGAQIFLRIVREWSQLKQAPLTRDKKNLAGQASFFIAAPPSVLVHELFHALTIWFFGGQVVDFGFTFYGGYVVPDRFFPPQQQWLISIAGTVGSLLFGVFVWFVLRQNDSRTFRFFGLRTLRTMLIISLIFYPLLLIGGFGDWATIYDFSATPILSGATAVAHIFILALFYRAEKRGWFEMAGFESVSAETRFNQLEQEALHNPQDQQQTIVYIEALNQGGAPQKATTQIKAYLQQHPEDAEAYVVLAGLEAGKNEHVPKKSKESAEKALDLGLNEPGSKAAAYRILGEYALERNQYQEAVNQFSQAIALVSGTIDKENPTSSYQAFWAHLYYRRSVAYRRQNSFDLAHQDIQNALELAQGLGDGRIQLYTQELENIQQHAGRQLGNSTNAPS